MNDKEFCQRYFALILFAEIAQIGIKNGNVSDRVTNLKQACLDCFTRKIKKYCQKETKMRSRIERKALLPIYALFTDKQTNFVNTHKLILGIHPAIIALKCENLLDEDVENIIEEFFKIEGEQDTTFDGKSISNEDWLKLKVSADKKVEEIITILKNI